MLRCAEIAGADELTGILEKYFEAIQALNTPAPPTDIITLITSLYRFQSERKRFATLFNAKFETWIQSRDGIAALENLCLPSDITAEETIPSTEIAKRVLSAITTEASETANNIIRRKILFDNWNGEFAAPFVGTLSKILQAATTQNIYSPEIEFVIESLLLKNQLVEFPDANQLLPMLPQLYDRVTEAQGKIEISKAAIVFALLSRDSSVRTTARNFLLNVWRTLGDTALRKSLEFVKAVDSPETSSLLSTAIQQELTFITNERDVPSERTEQRLALCFDYSDSLPPSSIEDVLIRSLEAERDELLSRWLQTIHLHKDQLDARFYERLATRCIDLALSGANRQTRIEILLNGLTEAIAKLPTDKRLPFTQRYFELVKSQNANIRNAAATTLAAIRDSLSDTQEFKIQVANVLGELRRDLKNQELIQYRPTIDAFMLQSDLFGEYEWRDLADLSKRMLSLPDLSIQEFGMALVERTPAIPEANQAEVVHLLISIEKSSSNLKERASKKLDQLENSDLSAVAKEELEKRHQNGTD